MLPSQSHLAGKRKFDDSNPLLNAAAAKRAKKEAKLGASTKRKITSDDPAGGMLIVRAPDTIPSQSQTTTSNNHVDLPPPRFLSQPPQAGPSRPPSKKFRADSEFPNRQRANSRSKPNGVADSTSYEDSEVEKDVRAMEDETDRLRRNSRAHTTVDSSLLAKDSEMCFPSRSEPGGKTNSKGKSKLIEISIPLPDDETPQIERNKQLRKGAMTAIINGRSRTPEPTADSSRGHRRKSSVSRRGKRTSASFEATGIITQPHNSVSESSFYKHIDADLPEPERIRQLLIWCSLRASSTPTHSSKASPSQPAPLPLPPLSTTGVQVLKSVQEELVRMMAEKSIDLNLYSSGPSTSSKPSEDLRENEQNVRNRRWEVTYTRHIQQSQAEDEAWKKVAYSYEAYIKKQQASLEKRSAILKLQPPSEKAKGKRRATGDENDLESHLMPQENEISPEFQSALALAKSVMGHRAVGDHRIAGGGRLGLTKLNLSREELDAEIKQRLSHLEPKVDHIFTLANTARTATNIAEKALTERFDILSASLTSRMNPLPVDEAAPGSSSQLLSTYVAASGSTGADPLDLMRALSRVDQERPPAQVGDAARRAAREVQRAGENGAVAVGDRRLTGVPATPRKTPGTPRRANTPSRDR